MVIVPTVLQQSLEVPPASEDVLLDGRAAQPVPAAEQHHGVEAGIVPEQGLYVSQQRSALPSRERGDDGQDQQQGVGPGPQESRPALRLLPDSLRGSPDGEPVPPGGVHDGDPAAADQRLPPQTQLRLLP